MRTASSLPRTFGWAQLAPQVAAGETAAVADQVHLTGQAVSYFGDHLYLFAVVWWALLETDSVSAATAVVLVAAVAAALVAPAAGTVIDRTDRVRLLIGVNATYTAVTLFTGLLMVTGSLVRAGCFAAGVLLAAHGVRFLPALRDGPLLVLGLAAVAVGDLVFGLAPVVAVACLGSLLGGAGTVVTIVASRTWFQREVPAEVQGRVFSLRFRLTMLVRPIGLLGGGVASGSPGPPGPSPASAG